MAATMAAAEIAALVAPVTHTTVAATAEATQTQDEWCRVRQAAAACKKNGDMSSHVSHVCVRAWSARMYEWKALTTHYTLV